MSYTYTMEYYSAIKNNEILWQVDRSGGYHSEWGNLITKEYTWYTLTDRGILEQKVKIPKIQFSKHKLKKKEDESMDTSFLLRMGKNTHGRNYKVWSWDRRERKDYPETVPHGDLSHKQPSNPDTIAYASKIFLTGPWYSCLLWGYASAWQI